MALIMPHNDIDEFISQMTENDYNNMLTQYDYQSEAYIAMPKFTVEQRINMNAILQALGINKAFSPQAEFPGMGMDLYLSSVIHQAKVIVDEEGTEAAAATVAIMTLKSAMPSDEPFEFVADKPFIFMIVDNTNNRPLFTGVIKNLD